MKSTKNINSIDVPTNFYQKTQQRYTKYFENLKKNIGFFSATKFEVETVFALLGSLCLKCLLLKVERLCFHIIIFRRY